MLLLKEAVSAFSPVLSDVRSFSLQENVQRSRKCGCSDMKPGYATEI